MTVKKLVILRNEVTKDLLLKMGILRNRRLLRMTVCFVLSKNDTERNQDA